MFKLSVICCNTRSETPTPCLTNMTNFSKNRIDELMNHQWRIWCPDHIRPTLASVLVVSIFLISFFHPLTTTGYPFWGYFFTNFLATYCLFCLYWIYLNLVLFIECHDDFCKQPSATGNDAKICLMIKSERKVIHSKYFWSIETAF